MTKIYHKGSEYDVQFVTLTEKDIKELKQGMCLLRFDEDLGQGVALLKGE